VPAVENLNKSHISRFSNIHLEKNTLNVFLVLDFFQDDFSSRERDVLNIPM